MLRHPPQSQWPSTFFKRPERQHSSAFPASCLQEGFTITTQVSAGNVPLQAQVQLAERGS